MAGGSTRQALAHLRVLDLTDGIAGAYCTKLMAGFGAEVIKVERPGTGDTMRGRGPFVTGSDGKRHSIPFRWFNTAKKSVAIDISGTSGAALVGDLAAAVDVLVESFPPDHMEQIGLGFDRLSARNPRLVVTSITNFGQTGPYRHFQAEDITIYAMGGMMYATGDPKRAPLASGAPIAELAAGMKAYIATLMACYRTCAGGDGDHVDVSIHEAAMDNIEIGLAEYLHLGKVAKRNADEHPLVPWRAWPCRDGYAAIIGGPIRHWLEGAEMFEEPRLLGERYAHMAGRIPHRDEVRDLIAPWLAKHDKHEIFHEGQKRRLAFGYVATLDDVLAAPQYRARGYLVDDEVAGRMPGAPFRPARTPWVHAPAPDLGAHTEAVLRELLGLAPEAVSALVEEGVAA